ncbi:MAG: glycoside hydrolase family 3 C-terminal domain-containing protein [Acidobacteriia bacterium]|nr:glycoside hydrolase family 3 C-terminal domain-containing protein [Terriglobia bacterium]
MLVLALRADSPAQTSSQPWMNTRLSADERADLLLQQMTLDEKIQLLHGSMAFDFPKYPRPERALGGDGFVPGIARLGIPDLNLIGAGVGVTNLGKRPNGQSTPLPSSLAETATWNPRLAYEFGTVIGKETRDQGFNVSLGGGNDILREARNGRNFEYHGEDPVLAGKIIGPELKAIQDQNVIADIKHYAVNCQETDRMGVSSNLDKRALRELDLLAFEIGIQESGVGTVMCAYNRVNGIYSCENDYLLNQVLKKDWGFPGWVMSDWGATHSTVNAALAGLDQEFYESKFFSAPLKHAVEKGEVPSSRIDDMVHRILRTMFAVGVIDHSPVVQPIDVKGGAAVAQRVEEEGVVLLKNASNQLPLSKSSIHSIAVIGSHADVGVISGGGSAQVDPVGGNAFPTPPPPGPLGFLSVVVWDPSSPLRAIRSKAPSAKVEYNEGADPASAAKLARASDVAIVFANQHTHENADLPNLSLPDNQDTLIKQVAAANAHTIVVLETGDPVLMPWLDQVSAVLEAWYPGARGGDAIANILFGDVNPSGKLPISFPKSEADLPHATIPAPSTPPKEPTEEELNPPPALIDANYTEGLKVGYRWFDAENKEPLFPFGFGLSYTSFAYSELKITSGSQPQVSFRLKNTGSRAGAETAQLYLGLPPSAGEPPKRLVAWKKVQLAPDKEETVTLKLDPRLMSIFNVEKNDWELVPGDYRVYAGGSSRDTPLTGTLSVASGKLP